MRRHRGFSARLRKSHFVLASNPLPGTRPADSPALLFLHVCQMWRFDAHARTHARTHTHTHTQMLSAVPIFSDTSHSQERQSLSTRCRQPPCNPHTLFHSPISKPSSFFLINFLKRLFTLLNFSCLRARVYHQPWQKLNNLKKRSALYHHRSSISTKASQAPAF